MIDSHGSGRGQQSGTENPGDDAQSVASLTRTALQLETANRWAEGVTVNQAITRLEPDNWQAWSRLGRCHARSGDPTAAIKIFRHALTIRSEAALHNELGATLMDAGDGAGAAAEFRRAIEIDPTSAVAFSNLGIALRLTGKLHDARQAFERSLAINALNAEAHGNLGNLLRDLGELDAAIQSLQECVRLLQPEAPDAYAFLAGALLEAGRHVEALSAIERALRLDPVNRTAFAYKAVALQEAGDLEAARFLLDLEGLIDASTFTQVAGFSSVRDFNDRLAAHVLQHPTLSFERTGNATRFGSHTSNLLAGGDALTAQFESMINERVRDYFATRAIRPDHPFLAHRMKSWSSVAWGVVMRTQGHQVPHIHASAWLSGVYYAKVPPSVRKDSNTKQGWIEFGSPPEKMQSNRQVLKKFFFPEEGKMILFPSYFYHKTVPLESGEERISVAFDVAPGRPRLHNQ